MNNHRQLSLAWRMYADDNRDRLVYASEDPLRPETYASTWTLTHMDTDGNNRGNWDISYDMAKRPLWIYAKNPSIYKCPADHSMVKVNGTLKPRIRTMSMNLFMGGFGGTDGGWTFASDYRFFFKMADPCANGAPGAAKTFVFLDMREDCVNWGNFLTDMVGYPDKTEKFAFTSDFPGMYHHLASGFSFVDGHSEIRRWRDARTTPPLGTLFTSPIYIPSPNNVDVAWLQDHTTRPR
jgi:hypothetical protein